MLSCRNACGPCGVENSMDLGWQMLVQPVCKMSALVEELRDYDGRTQQDLLA